MESITLKIASKRVIACLRQPAPPRPRAESAELPGLGPYSKSLPLIFPEPACRLLPQIPFIQIEPDVGFDRQSNRRQRTQCSRAPENKSRAATMVHGGMCASQGHSRMTLDDSFVLPFTCLTLTRTRDWGNNARRFGVKKEVPAQVLPAQLSAKKKRLEGD